MIEIVDVDLEAAFADGMQKLIRDFVADLGDNLKGRLDAKSIIQIHKRSAEIAAYGSLDVVGHGGASGIAVRPKPDERDTLAAPSADDAGHHAIEQTIDRLVDRPAWEASALPSAGSHALQVFAHRSREKGAHSVVGFAAETFGNGPTSGRGPVVTLEAQILDNLVEVKGENTDIFFNAQSGGNVVKLAG